MDLSRSIVPLVRLNTDGQATDALGTGFFVGPIPTLITAYFLLANTVLGEGEQFGVVLGHPHAQVIYPLSWVRNSEDRNLNIIAAIPCPELADVVPLSLCRTPITCEEDVLAYQFSPIGDNINLRFRSLNNTQFFVHKGNVLRHFRGWFATGEGDQFVTSFPAPLGAAGAPVLRTKDKAVVGLMIGNESLELGLLLVYHPVTGKAYHKPTSLAMGRALAATELINFLQASGYVIDTVL